jgi:hypothetical protein
MAKTLIAKAKCHFAVVSVFRDEEDGELEYSVESSNIDPFPDLAKALLADFRWRMNRHDAASGYSPYPFGDSFTGATESIGGTVIYLEPLKEEEETDGNVVY